MFETFRTFALLFMQHSCIELLYAQRYDTFGGLQSPFARVTVRPFHTP